jgi:hypothetical protein
MHEYAIVSFRVKPKDIYFYVVDFFLVLSEKFLPFNGEVKSRVVMGVVSV